MVYPVGVMEVWFCFTHKIVYIIRFALKCLCLINVEIHICKLQLSFAVCKRKKTKKFS